MKVELNNITIINLLREFKKFDNITGTLGYAIAKTKQNMEKELAPFKEQRDKIFQKYPNASREKDEGEYKRFVDEIDQISEMKTEVDFVQISKEEFNNADYYDKNCTVKDYEMLEALFVADDK